MTTDNLRIGVFVCDCGSNIAGVVDTEALRQYAETLPNVVVAVGVLSVLVYFYFSREHRGGIAGVSRLGIWFLMVSFGAAFGYTVMGRIALLAVRLEFLFDDWLWLIDPRHLRPGDWTGWW